MNIDFNEVLSITLTNALQPELDKLRRSITDLDEKLTVTSQELAVVKAALARRVLQEAPEGSMPVFDRLGMLEDRCADLTAVLGSLVDLDDLQAAVVRAHTGHFLLSDEFGQHIANVANQEATSMMDEHTENYDHDSFLEDGDNLFNRVRSCIRDMSFSATVEVD